MGIYAHFVATSSSESKLSFAELISFIKDLLNEQICSFPAAILVGDARDLGEFYWAGPDDPYITPNSPGSMLDFEATTFPQELIWYSGSDMTAFFIALSSIPFGEKDCCISFPAHARKLVCSTRDVVPDIHELWGWDGAVIYALRKPFLLNFPDNVGGASIYRQITHCFTLLSLVGGGSDVIETPLQTLLERYFGSSLIMEKAIYG